MKFDYMDIRGPIYIHILPNGCRAIYDGTFAGFKVYMDEGIYSLNGFGLEENIQKELKMWFNYVMGLNYA